MNKVQASNENMLNEMKSAMSEILTKYGIANHNMSTFVTYGNEKSAISIRFDEKSNDTLFETRIQDLKYSNVIKESITVENFKSISIPKSQRSKEMLTVVGIEIGRPYKVVASDSKGKTFTLKLGIFLDTYAPHFRK